MKLPPTWGWFGFGIIILAVTLAAIWAAGQFFDFLFPGWGGRLLLVCFILLPIGIAIFGSSELVDTVFGGKDASDQE